MTLIKDGFRKRLGLPFILLAVLSVQAQTNNYAQKDTRGILEEFVESYKSDPMALTALFGIRIGNQWWHIKVERQEHPYEAGKKNQYTFHNLGPHKVHLFEGPPESPTWYFRFDSQEVFDAICAQKLIAGTAAARSTSADKVSFDIENMQGFDSSNGDTALAYSTMEHFWKPDPVEITRFGREGSLRTHGAAIVSLYMMKDKRISWFTLGQEETANGDRGLDKGQCPNLFIITKGKGKAQVGSSEIDLEPGMSIFVGAYVKHVLYNPNPEPMEGILVLFGDNIDYARGQSYPDFLEEQNQFYEANEWKVREKLILSRKSIPGGKE